MLAKPIFLAVVMKIIKSTLIGLFVTGVTLIALLGLLELCYRYQLVDFYSFELSALNKTTSTNSSHKKVLVLGDSFSAQTNGYVQFLQDSLTGYDVINSAVPGTSMREMNLIAVGRIKQFKPDVLILQVYPGNDLVDITHPVNFATVSVARNLYWLAADKCWSLGWLNYKLAPLRKLFDNEQTFVVPKANDTFSIGGYSGRIKLLLRADRQYLQKSMDLSDSNYYAGFSKMAGWMSNILSEYRKVNPNGKVLLLVIPHCSSVGEEYLTNYRALGAELSPLVGEETNFSKQLKSALPTVNVVDVTKPLQESYGLGVNCYYRNDEHTTPEGAKVIYQKLSGIISQ